jgi:hypothetical protein
MNSFQLVFKEEKRREKKMNEIFQADTLSANMFADLLLIYL